MLERLIVFFKHVCGWTHLGRHLDPRPPLWLLCRRLAAPAAASSERGRPGEHRAGCVVYLLSLGNGEAGPLPSAVMCYVWMRWVGRMGTMLFGCDWTSCEAFCKAAALSSLMTASCLQCGLLDCLQSPSAGPGGQVT